MLTPRFFLPVVALLLAAEKDGGGGGTAPEKPLSLDAQLTAAQTRVTELEGLQTAWGQERTTLTGERDTAQTRATELQTQLATATGEQTRLSGRVTELEGQLSAVNGSVTTLTKERDDAVKLAANPSAQARTILASAGAPSVSVKPAGQENPGVTKRDVSQLSGIEKAIALHQDAVANK